MHGGSLCLHASWCFYGRTCAYGRAIHLPFVGITRRKCRTIITLNGKDRGEGISSFHSLRSHEPIHDNLSRSIHIPYRTILSLTQGCKNGVDIALIATTVHTLRIVHVIFRKAACRSICRVDRQISIRTIGCISQDGL